MSWQSAKMVSVFIIALFYLQILLTHGSITCQDEKGDNVDWFIVYKLPRLDDNPNPLVQDGFGYYYMDVNNPHWTEGKVSLNKTGHAISNTLSHIYKNYAAKDVMYLMYNDETPEKNVSYSHGHTKGDLCFDDTSGFWLVHSLPRFPPYGNTRYGYPNSGRTYGQTFLCVTYSYSMLDHIGGQLTYTYPQVYDYNLPESFRKDNPNIAATIGSKHVKTPPWNQTIMLTSSAGQKFTSFAKYTNFNADLYHDWLAPYYGDDVYVESWLNGPGSMYSNCSDPHKAFNIKQVKVSETLFSESHDHSKWAVTADTGWTCIGDINRQYSQERRAGGTVCFNVAPVWKQFRQSITVYQHCPQPPPKLTNKPNNRQTKLKNEEANDVGTKQHRKEFERLDNHGEEAVVVIS